MGFSLVLGDSGECSRKRSFALNWMLSENGNNL